MDTLSTTIIIRVGDLFLGHLISQVLLTGSNIYLNYFLLDP